LFLPGGGLQRYHIAEKQQAVMAKSGRRFCSSKKKPILELPLEKNQPAEMPLSSSKSKRHPARRRDFLPFSDRT